MVRSPLFVVASLCGVAAGFFVPTDTTQRHLVVDLHVQNSSTQRKSGQRVVSVADLHGDFLHFQEIMEDLGLATFSGAKATWTGGNAVLVSTGDTADRGEHSRSIFLAFKSLAAQAAAAGGEVVNLLGNHDLMNMQGDFRYVAEAEWGSSGDYGGRPEREKEWSPQGVIGQDLRSRYLAAAVRGDTLFVHGGLDPKYLRGGSLDKLNNDVRSLLQADRVSSEEEIFGDTGPFWDRDFAELEESEICDLAAETLRLAGAKRMTMGHTIQDNGVNTRCHTPEGPRLVLADTAISVAYGHSRPSAVEYLEDGSVSAQYFPADYKGAAWSKLLYHPDGLRQVLDHIDGDQV